MKITSNSIVFLGWIGVLIVQFCAFLAGAEPSWISVFCPLFGVIIESFMRIVDNDIKLD